jgi:hypothetical protein
MKKQHSIFASLFGGGKSDEPLQQKKPRPVTISAYSQSNVLQERMKEQKLTHGETVTASLSPVRLEMNYGYMTMYFCPMKSIQIVEKINEGDGGRIPEDAKVEGLNVPSDLKPGFYTLKNITLTSNGTMQVKATSETTWEQL